MTRHWYPLIFRRVVGAYFYFFSSLLPQWKVAMAIAGEVWAATHYGLSPNLRWNNPSAEHKRLGSFWTKKFISMRLYQIYFDYDDGFWQYI